VVSDPGVELVGAAHAAGIRVEPIPGPSAALAALSASGLPAERFVFVGFPPSRSNARKDWFRALAVQNSTAIIYEAPHRIRKTLTDLLESVGNRTIALARELTKAHEELVVRQISEHLSLQQEPRGEYTLVVPAEETANIVQMPYREEALRQEFNDLIGAGSSPRGAVRALAKKYARSSREVYSVVHQIADNSG
jgi:16S rRNA (cytidine1402-2'-O)-methyltransferase